MALRPHDSFDGYRADDFAAQADDCAKNALKLLSWAHDDRVRSIHGPTQQERDRARYWQGVWLGLARDNWDLALIFDFERGALP